HRRSGETQVHVAGRPRARQRRRRARHGGNPRRGYEHRPEGADIGADAGPRRSGMSRRLLSITVVAAALVAPRAPAVLHGQRGRGQQQAAPQPAAKRTYVRLANNANAVLVEPLEPGPQSRILAINTHPDHNNNFEYFVGRELVARGYRALGINYYGPEETMEEFLPAIAAAVNYGRAIPGVEKVRS